MSPNDSGRAVEKQLVCVVVPVYKKEMSRFEVASLRQCKRILGNHPIILIVPRGLTLSDDIACIANEIKELNPACFKSIEAYNKMLLAPWFYRNFTNYEFMLIYQLDAYVFRDELKAWCQKGYDYLGGVWFKGYTKNPEQGFVEWVPGNGGLSLRKVDSCVKALTSRARAFGPSSLLKQLVRNLLRGRGLWIVELLVFPVKILGFRNTVRWEAQNFAGYEDVFFALHAPRMISSFVVPSVEEAALFSWDRRPDYLFGKHQVLPFGCHAWFREEPPYEANGSFWRNHIAGSWDVSCS